MGWKMGVMALLALGLALAAMVSLFSVGETSKATPATAVTRGTDSGEGIRDESREALRDLLRDLDSGKETSP